MKVCFLSSSSRNTIQLGSHNYFFFFFLLYKNYEKNLDEKKKNLGNMKNIYSVDSQAVDRKQFFVLDWPEAGIFLGLWTVGLAPLITFDLLISPQQAIPAPKMTRDKYENLF